VLAAGRVSRGGGVRSQLKGRGPGSRFFERAWRQSASCEEKERRFRGVWAGAFPIPDFSVQFLRPIYYAAIAAAFIFIAGVLV
jgi:hypothetical protein